MFNNKSEYLQNHFLEPSPSYCSVKILLIVSKYNIDSENYRVSYRETTVIGNQSTAFAD